MIEVGEDRDYQFGFVMRSEFRLKSSIGELVFEIGALIYDSLQIQSKIPTCFRMRKSQVTERRRADVQRKGSEAYAADFSNQTDLLLTRR